MTQYIALLRGINLGNKNKVLMADLRELFTKAGYTDIKTYIQTGNVVFSSNESEDLNELSSKIEQEIFTAYGFEIPVIVETKDEFLSTVNNNPFAKEDIERLHVTFLKDKPKERELEEIKNFSSISSHDQFEIIDRTVYIYCTKRYMQTKFGNTFFEQKLKVKASTRNWKTVLKIKQLFE